MSATIAAQRHTVTRDDPADEIITVTVKCPTCGAPGTLDVPREGYYNWIAGWGVRRALPELNDEDREKLLCGICRPCWTRMFEDGPDGATRIVDFLARGVRRRSIEMARVKLHEEQPQEETVPAQ